MVIFTGFICGAVFGLGLAVSGMLNPAKVSAFLDLAGAWDPSLAFVMGGGLAVNLLAFRLLQNARLRFWLISFICRRRPGLTAA